MTMAASSSDRQTLVGTVKTIKLEQGFGFINHIATGEDYFFHRSAVKGDRKFEDLELFQEVDFEPSDGPKGPRAMNVRSRR